MKDNKMRKSLAALAFAIALLHGFAAMAEPVKIAEPDQFGDAVNEYRGSVLLVICKDTEQCERTETVIKAAEGDSRSAAVLSEQEGGLPGLRFALAEAKVLSVISEDFDKNDRETCLQDATKAKEKCVDPAYPIFILKRATATSYGVEGLFRGEVDKDAVVNMILQSIPAVEPKNTDSVGPK